MEYKKICSDCGFLPFCFDKLETQRERVYTVIDAFGVSDVFEMSLSLHLSVLNKRRPLGNCSLDDFERDTWSRIDRILTTFDEEYIKNNFRTKDTYTLIRCFSILSYYNTVYGNYHSLNTYNNIIISVILKRGFIIPENPLTEPVQIIDGNIHIFSGCLLSFMQKHQEIYADFRGSLFLKEKEPVISLYEDGKKTAEYRLQTEAGEDFSGKYYQYCVRIVFEQYSGVNHPVPVVIIDGFISDTPDDRSMSADDVGFRIEVHYLECGGEGGKKIYEDSFGKDLVCKGLKASNRTIPSNVRLIGVCPACGKSFAFHAYSLYMAQSDIAYSDDGLDCCEIIEKIDKETWSYAENRKVFRYYNSFVCPHCKTPYFDYKTHPESKFFGVPGCVHLGRELYRSNVDYVGTKIDDNYLIKEKIDEDSITKTYLAENKYGIACTVKVIDKKGGANHSRVLFEEAYKSAMLLKNFDHPLVPRMLDCIDSDDCVFVITRHIEGKMLDTVIKEQGILPEETAIKIALDIAEALKYIHNLPHPLIHRNVKPGSIMVTDDNAVLFDFDIAVEYIPNKPVSLILGTVGFAAPEQYTEYFDTRADIYGLGATLYCMLTNDDLRKTRVKQPMIGFNKDVSRKLESIIDKCLAANPDDRYQNCGEVIAALTKYNNNSAKKSLFKNFFNKR